MDLREKLQDIFEEILQDLFEEILLTEPDSNT